MVLTGVANSFKQALRIKRSLAAAISPAQVYEERIADTEVVISIRVETSSDVERLKEIFKTAGCNEISEFTEAA